MNPISRSFRAMMLLLGSYAVLTFLYVLPVDHVMMQHRTSSVFYFIFAACITLYFDARILEPRVRKNLIGVGAMIIFWCILRTAKYIAFEESESIARFIWYLYYIPMLTIPQFSLKAALAVGETEDKKPPLILVFTRAITVACILIVLTNDLHQLVFRFRLDFVNWDFDYSRSVLFWIITIWDYLFFFSSTAVLFRKCRLSASRKLAWIPAFYLALGVLGLYLLNTGHLPRMWGETIGEFPDMACYTLGGFWILCIAIGLVPSNKGYEKLLQGTSLATRITDLAYNTVYQSLAAVPMTKTQLTSSGPIPVDENTVVHRSPVTGGYAYWQVDISELNRINLELEEAQEQISEEADLIRRENEMKEKQAQIDAKSKAYDQIAVRVLPQSQKIAVLSAEAHKNRALFDRNMRLVGIYAAYIKRMSNMMLLAAEGKLKKTELTLAIAESVRYLNKAGVLSECSGESDESLVDGEMLIDIYEKFEMLLEQSLPTLEALYITFAGNVLKLSIEGAELTVPDDWDAAVEADEGTTFVRLYLRKGGDSK